MLFYAAGVLVVPSAAVVGVDCVALNYHHSNRQNSSDDIVLIKFSAKRENS